MPTLTTDDTAIRTVLARQALRGCSLPPSAQTASRIPTTTTLQDADAITYVLGVKNGGSNVASGLTDTLSGDAVVLNKVGNDIVGTVTGTALEVFRISVNATGAVTFTQSRSVVHNDPADPAEIGPRRRG